MTLKLNTTEHDHIPEEFTIEDLQEAGMTDQEIAALNEGDDPIVAPGPEAAAAEPLPGDPDAAPGVGAGAAETAEAAAQAAAAAAQAATPEQAVADPAPAPATEVEQQPEDPFAALTAPELAAPVDVTAHEATIQQVEKDLVSLVGDYDDGEITQDEFVQKQNEIIERKMAAQTAIQDAAGVAESNTQAVQQHWYGTLDIYKGLGTEALWSPEHLQAWDRHLRAVSGNSGYAALELNKQVEMAHRLYAAEYEATNGKPLGIPVPGQAAAPTPKVDDDPQPANGQEKHKVRDDQRPDAPTTLGGINSDTQAEVEDSVFASVDRTIMKDPIRAEEMVASLNDEQMARFLEGA